jgi:glycosyltransferase involved in cell wall biosynthesis
MPTPFSTILRGVNRKPGGPFRILCMDTHEAYQTMLAKTGHEFYALQHPGMKQWDLRFRNCPENYYPLRGEDPQAQIRPDMVFDIVLSQNKFGQYQVLSQIARGLNCPLVSLEHTLPHPSWNEEAIAKHREMWGEVNVFISEYSLDAWRIALDSSVRVVHHGIDTDWFEGWRGGDGRVLTVVNGYPQRDWCCGFQLYQQVTRGLPVNPWGDAPGFSQPAQNEYHLRNLYRQAGVFLNTSLVSPVPTTLLEAMAVGCPVVTTATCMIPQIVEDGVNGFVSNDPAVLRHRLELILRDEQLARRLGEAARWTIQDRFSQASFVSQWNEVFEEAVQG